MKYMTMTEMAAYQLREAIINGILPPGAQLVPATLECELGLGRVAIREAIRELSGSGLVVSVPNKGTYVTDPPDREELLTIFRLRYQLEGDAAGAAVGRISAEELRRLEDLYRKMEDESLPYADTFLFNRRFHAILYRASGWRFLCRVIGQLLDQVLLYRSSQRPPESFSFRPFNEEHRQILDALRNGDPDEARRMTVANLQRGLDAVLLLEAPDS